jgi:hypothetical protein
MQRLLVLAAGVAVLAAALAAPAAATRPVTQPTGDISCKYRFWPLFTYMIKDRDSRKADVTILVGERGGPVLARVPCGWQRTNRVVTVPMLSWRCPFPRGVYVWRVRAVDREGAHQRKAWPARLTIF